MNIIIISILYPFTANAWVTFESTDGVEMDDTLNFKTANPFTDKFDDNQTYKTRNPFNPLNDNEERSSLTSTPSLMSGSISPSNSEDINSCSYSNNDRLDSINDKTVRFITTFNETSAANLSSPSDNLTLTKSSDTSLSIERIHDHRPKSPFSIRKRNQRKGFYLPSSRADILLKEIETYHSSTDSLQSFDTNVSFDNESVQDKYDAIRAIRPNSVEVKEEKFPQSTGWSPELLSTYTGPYGWSKQVLMG